MPVSTSLSKEYRVFPYYAGYARSFAKTTLNSLGLASESIVVDPWNGSGTTTLAAAAIGVRAIGFDLNPIMVLVAKAELFFGEKEKIIKVAERVIKLSQKKESALTEDPLEIWFYPSSARLIRSIEAAINENYVGTKSYSSLFSPAIINSVRPLVAFLYVCLFRSVRKLLLDFIPTNPTWVKNPKSPSNRKRPSREVIESGFLSEVRKLSSNLAENTFDEKKLDGIDIKIGDSKNLPLAPNSVDAILTSPPYCTRIDYAVATSIELAVLRCTKSDFARIRRSLMGSSTVEKAPIAISKEWGGACIKFLDKLYKHPSQASKTYYYKTHLQYFSSLKQSIDEIARVLKPGAHGIIVVQDSYYKEIHNDVAKITIDMADLSGLRLVHRKDFQKSNSMSVINTRARKYLSERNSSETVLVFSLA
jgi:DNA modification methylase